MTSSPESTDRGAALFTAPPASARLLPHLAAIAAAAVTGAEATIAGVAIIGPRAPWPAWDDLTTMGKSIAHPEYDLLAYVAGCALTLVLIAGYLALVRRIPETIGPVIAIRLTAIALGSAALFAAATDTVLWLAHNEWTLSAMESAVLAAVPLLTFVSVIAAMLLPAPVEGRDAPTWSRRMWDVAVAIGTFHIVFIPAVSRLAARIYEREELFHWNYFLVGPMLQYAHGQALGTDIFSQYGVGWPMLFGAMSAREPMFYEPVLATLIAYAAVYFVVLYRLLTVVTRSRSLAATGLFAALLMTVFAPDWQNLGMATVWQWPSSSVLRSPMDVWFFLAAFAFLRNPTTWRGRAVAFTAALGLLFETDTGVGLLVLFVIVMAGARFHGVAPRVCAAAVIVYAGTLLMGLSWASRGTVFSAPRAFLLGWLEAPFNFAGGGEGSLALLSRVSVGHVVLFALFVAGALFAVGVGGWMIYARRRNPLAEFYALVGLFTLFRLIVFVQRSTPTNLWHAGVPAAILLTGAIAWGLHIVPPGRVGLSFRKAAGPVLMAVMASALWISPSFRTYPNWPRLMVSGMPPRDVCLIGHYPAICGLPGSYAEERSEVATIAGVIRSVTEAGGKVAMVDHGAPLYSMAANAPLWGRDAGALYNLLTYEAMDRYIADLLGERPLCVIIRAEAPNTFFADTWGAIRAALPEVYELEGVVGRFEVWMLPAP